jgi:hypothetical protein
MSASGDTLEITIEHPDVGSRNFSTKADQDVIKDIGGYTAELQMNGNGTGHKKMSAKPWELSGIESETDDIAGDQEFLQAVQDSPDLATITWQHILGTVYSGQGTLTGDLKHNTNAGYTGLSIMGPGKFKKIA